MGARSASTPRRQIRGLTDSAFRSVALLEAGRDAAWPWEVTAAQG
jgi:hypothetical protein